MHPVSLHLPRCRCLRIMTATCTVHYCGPRLATCTFCFFVLARRRARFLHVFRGPCTLALHTTKSRHYCIAHHVPASIPKAPLTCRPPRIWSLTSSCLISMPIRPAVICVPANTNTAQLIIRITERPCRFWKWLPRAHCMQICCLWDGNFDGTPGRAGGRHCGPISSRVHA